MFSSVGWGEILVLLAAALIILGPERLPGAVSWTMQSIRKARDYATGATDKLRDEMGGDFEQFREPIQQINELRQMSPKSVVTKHLLGGDSSSVDELTRNVRETLDIAGTLGSPTGRSDAAAPAAPEPTTFDEPTAQPSATKRSHNVSDWDAT